MQKFDDGEKINKTFLRLSIFEVHIIYKISLLNVPMPDDMGAAVNL